MVGLMDRAQCAVTNVARRTSNMTARHMTLVENDHSGLIMLSEFSWRAGCPSAGGARCRQLGFNS